ncbi:MAG TPA: HAD-IB family phosphatase [Candidatus Saccharimonadales bacterium]|nr:HAD-IB family phosphatase [Candidatus Saccharimonadales bacterium]
MNIAVFDFDKTIYAGDSTVDFYFFCLSRNPSILRYVPLQCWHILRFKLGLETRTAMKSAFLIFLKDIVHIEKYVTDFWLQQESKIKPWYLEKAHGTHVIISASPQFLLKPVCDKLHAILIATNVDAKTGRIVGANCYGGEKVVRLRKEIKDARVIAAYSDSRSDSPLLALADSAYAVKGHTILPWDEYWALPRLRRMLLR